MSWRILLDWRSTAAVWVVLIGVFLYPMPAPIDFIGGDSVGPVKVKPGGSITVSRNMSVTNAVPMQVTRTMVKGDCKKNCEILDLVHGRLLLDEGEYRNLEREHVIPLLASPGIWRLKFSVAWSDAFGRQHSKDLPELQIEVVR